MRNYKSRLSFFFSILLALCVFSFSFNAFADESDYDEIYDTWSDDYDYDYDSDYSDDDYDGDYDDDYDSDYDDDYDSDYDDDDYDSDYDDDDYDDDDDDESDDDEDDDDEEDDEDDEDYSNFHDNPIEYWPSSSYYYSSSHRRYNNDYYTVNADQRAAERVREGISSDDFSVTVFRELSHGMSGDDVLLLQEILIAEGYLEGPADGSLGAMTSGAIISFQEDHGLHADGYAGLNTLETLMSLLPSSGNGKILEFDTKGIGKRFLYVENYEDNKANNLKLLYSIIALKNSFFDYSLYIYNVDTSAVYMSSEISSAGEYAIDLESSYFSLLKALKEGSSTVELGWNHKTYRYNNWIYYGPTYGYTTFIAVSIDDQHLWYFTDGYLYLDTPVVTGMTTEHRHTPLGIYQIINHATNITLEGRLGPERWSSFVNYWMAISGDGIGLHDSSWRGDNPLYYGGYVYTYDGSHGCINIPYPAAEELFYSTYDGIPVIVY